MHLDFTNPVFQAFKFMETEPRLAEHIRNLRTPREALREATRMRSRQRSDWFDVNIGYMEIILEAKFSQHPHLRRELLDTGNSELIEASPVGRSLLEEGHADYICASVRWIRSGE